MRNDEVTSLDMMACGLIGDDAIRTLGEALWRTQPPTKSRLSYLRYSKLDLSETTTCITLESHRLTIADMVLLSVVLRHNKSCGLMILDTFRIGSAQLNGSEPLDPRAPWAAQAILGLSRSSHKDQAQASGICALRREGEGFVEKPSFVSRFLSCSGLMLSQISRLWEVLEKDEQGERASLSSFARLASVSSELSLACLALHVQKDPLTDFLVFRWKSVYIPEVKVADLPDDAVGRLKVRNVHVGMLAPTTGPTFAWMGTGQPPRRRQTVGERVRFVQPNAWLRAVDFFPDGVLNEAGQPVPWLTVSCSIPGMRDFDLRVEVREWAYQFVGARLRLESSDVTQPPFCTTVIKHGSDKGMATCALDNTNDTKTLTIQMPPVSPLDHCASMLRGCSSSPYKGLAANAPRTVSVSMKTDGGNSKQTLTAEVDGSQTLRHHAGQRLLVLLPYGGVGRVEEAIVTVTPLLRMHADTACPRPCTDRRMSLSWT